MLDILIAYRWTDTLTPFYLAILDSDDLVQLEDEYQERVDDILGMPRETHEDRLAKFATYLTLVTELQRKTDRICTNRKA